MGPRSLLAVIGGALATTKNPSLELPCALRPSMKSRNGSWWVWATRCRSRTTTVLEHRWALTLKPSIALADERVPLR